MNTWKVILATLVIFGTGILTGGLLVGYSDRAARPPAAPTAGEPGAASAQSQDLRSDLGRNLRANRQPPLRKQFVDHLDRELKLTPLQRERIEKIITDGQERNRELWRVEMMTTRQRIRAELAPKQQARFQELLRQHQNDQRRALSTNEPSSD